jgi:hypothetical protein
MNGQALLDGRMLYRQTASFGHFGRDDFPWEKTVSQQIWVGPRPTENTALAGLISPRQSGWSPWAGRPGRLG